MKDENLFGILIGYKDSHFNIIIKWNHLQIRLKGKEAIDWKEEFPQAFISRRKTSSKKVLLLVL
jgi:hypothetical protein